jgi:hypothetical protein
MLAKTGDALARRLHSGTSLSLFLFLLISVVFVLPSLGFGKNNIPLYSDVAFSIVLIFGSMIA